VAFLLEPCLPAAPIQKISMTETLFSKIGLFRLNKRFKYNPLIEIPRSKLWGISPVGNSVLFLFAH
jgi:hypothetical protein